MSKTYTQEEVDAITALVLAEALAEPVKQEPIAWEATSDGVIKFVTDSRYKKFDPKIQRYYKPYRCSHCKEPVKQEPVAHYKDAPHTIYLQTGCDDPEDCECSFNEWGDTTWCTDQIHDTDIPYIRADYAAPVDAKAIRAEALDEAAKVCEQDEFQIYETAERCAAAIRGLK